MLKHTETGHGSGGAVMCGAGARRGGGRRPL